jgi:hypothetical protein
MMCLQVCESVKITSCSSQYLCANNNSPDLFERDQSSSSGRGYPSCTPTLAPSRWSPQRP